MYMNTLRAILFDLDGVLWNSSAAHEEAFQQVFHTAGIPPIRSYAKIAGMRTEEAIAVHLTSCGISADSEKVRELSLAKRELTPSLLEAKAELAPCLLEILQGLYSQHKLALCSSASPQTIECFLKKSSCGEFFSAIISGLDVKRAKPAPDIFLFGAHLLASNTKETLVVEDSVAGITAGISAGMSVLGIGEEALSVKVTSGVVGVLPNISYLTAWFDGRLRVGEDNVFGYSV